jgi:uncharacterized membrane protein
VHAQLDRYRAMMLPKLPQTVSWHRSLGAGREQNIAYVVWCLTLFAFSAGCCRMILRDGDSQVEYEILAVAIAVLLASSLLRFWQHRTLKYFAMLLATFAWSAAFVANQYGLFPTPAHGLATFAYIGVMLYLFSRRGEARR